MNYRYHQQYLYSREEDKWAFGKTNPNYHSYLSVGKFLINVAMFRKVTLLQTYMLRATLIFTAVFCYPYWYQNIKRWLCFVSKSIEYILSKNSQIHWIFIFIFLLKRAGNFSNIKNSQPKAHLSSRPADNKCRDYLYFIVQILIF